MVVMIVCGVAYGVSRMLLLLAAAAGISRFDHKHILFFSSSCQRWVDARDEWMQVVNYREPAGCTFFLFF
jgi:hypothetical protein